MAKMTCEILPMAETLDVSARRHQRDVRIQICLPQCAHAQDRERAPQNDRNHCGPPSNAVAPEEVGYQHDAQNGRADHAAHDERGRRLVLRLLVRFDPVPRVGQRREPDRRDGDEGLSEQDRKRRPQDPRLGARGPSNLASRPPHPHAQGREEGPTENHPHIHRSDRAGPHDDPLSDVGEGRREPPQVRVRCRGDDEVEDRECVEDGERE